LDLATADTVAGYYLSGGLDRNGLSQAWDRGETTVLIDALDEARMRVPEASFEDFLHDVLAKSQGRRLPTVLFGRTGVIEEARIMLAIAGIECPVLTINFFDQPQAVRFILSALGRLETARAYTGLATRLSARRQEYETVTSRFVETLGRTTAEDGTTFAGYAPVLEAMANLLAGATNISTLQHVPEQLQDRVLQELTRRILDREAEKLRGQVLAIPPNLRQQLYGPEEQLERLAARILGTAEPAIPSVLPVQFSATYENAFRLLFDQHPFLDGSGQHPSGAVFGAVIIAHALVSAKQEARDAAARRAGLPPQTANPFLVDFYLKKLDQPGSEPSDVAPEHVVLLYESMQARAGTGEVVYLTIEADEEDEEADVELLQVTTTRDGSPGATPKSISLGTSQLGELRFLRQLARTSVEAPQMDALIGSGNEIEIVTPVSLNVARLTLNCRALVVLSGEKRTGNGDATAIIEARELRGSNVERVPVLRDGAALQVSWPGVVQYPWTRFQLTEDGPEEPGIDYALGRLRKIIIAFRSHSRGELARYSHKIDHARMMKGPGYEIRDRLLQDGILSLTGDLYYLDPDKLGQVLGTSYHDLALKRFAPSVREYVRSIIGG
jgi:hypothetical protein